jgi:formate-dependent nitrite reductase membrane component NrfD
MLDSAWHIAKWLWLAVFAAYLIVQVLAIRRSTGEGKKRSQSILVAMAVAVMIQSWIQDAFENREASRISMLVVGALAAAATVFLVRFLLSQGGTKSNVGKDGAEDRIRQLNLS